MTTHPKEAVTLLMRYGFEPAEVTDILDQIAPLYREQAA